MPRRKPQQPARSDAPAPISLMQIPRSELGALRMRNQGLHPRLPREALVDAVRAVCGVQAQLTSAMMLALRARVSGLRTADVEQAMGDNHSLVRTWVMRGTLHLLAAEDVRWLVPLLGPVFIVQGKGRRLQLGLDEDKTRKGVDGIQAILSHSRPLSRVELIEKLGERGIEIERRGQAPIHLIGQAALEGIVCLGPDRQNGEPTYVLVDNWVDRQEPLSRETALAQLAWRYLAGYGPASPKDFARWSGLTLTEAKRGWELIRGEDRLVELSVDDLKLWQAAFTPKEASPFTPSSPVVRLLPAFDTYLLGYANRDDLVRPEHQREVYHGGQTVPVVLLDGLAAGVWRYERQGKRIKIKARPFESFNRQVQDLIAEEADDIGRFLGLAAELRYTIGGSVNAGEEAG